MSNTLKFGAGKWATGTDTVLAYNDENSNFKPLPFDFTRASTATVVNKLGLIEDVASGTPRIDFLGNTKGALLLEPQRTNSLLQSNNFNTSWSKVGVTVTSNVAVSPDGTTNADKLVGNNVSTTIVLNSVAFANGTYAMSVYVKAAEFSKVAIREGAAYGQYATFDLSAVSVLDTGDVGGGTVDSAKIESVGNGWYRCSARYTNAAGNLNLGIIPLPDSYTSGQPLGSYLGDGVSGVYIYAAQAEIGSYPTSLINTSGTAVTRVAETCSQTPPSGIIGQTEGTLFAEFEINANNTDGYNRILSIGDGTSSNRILLFAQNTEVFRFYIATGNVVQVDIVTSTSVLGGRHKVAFAYKANDFMAYVDGVQVGSDTSGTVPTCTNVYVGTHESGSPLLLEGGINQTLLYDTRLTNAELATLTTI